MDKWSQVNKDKIETTDFLSCGFVEPERRKDVYRVSSKEMQHWDENNIELRKKISELFFQYSKETKKTYDCTTYNCGIPEDTMRKIMNGRIRITRHFLSKFTIGLKIERETADKLFELQGRTLNPTDKFDFIVMSALKYGDDVSVFIEDVKEYCGIDLYKERSSKE